MRRSMPSTFSRPVCCSSRWSPAWPARSPSGRRSFVMCEPTTKSATFLNSASATRRSLSRMRSAPVGIAALLGIGVALLGAYLASALMPIGFARRIDPHRGAGRLDWTVVLVVAAVSCFSRRRRRCRGRAIVADAGSAPGGCPLFCRRCLRRRGRPAPRARRAGAARGAGSIGVRWSRRGHGRHHRGAGLQCRARAPHRHAGALRLDVRRDRRLDPRTRRGLSPTRGSPPSPTFMPRRAAAGEGSPGDRRRHAADRGRDPPGDRGRSSAGRNRRGRARRRHAPIATCPSAPVVVEGPKGSARCASSGRACSRPRPTRIPSPTACTSRRPPYAFSVKATRRTRWRSGTGLAPIGRRRVRRLDALDAKSHPGADPPGRPAPPAEIEKLRQVESLPKVLAGFLALLGAVALAHALVVGVRRRARDFAPSCVRSASAGARSAPRSRGKPAPGLAGGAGRPVRHRDRPVRVGTHRPQYRGRGRRSGAVRGRVGAPARRGDPGGRRRAAPARRAAKLHPAEILHTE